MIRLDNVFLADDSLPMTFDLQVAFYFVIHIVLVLSL